jgi:hypothetical protein
VTAGRKLGPRTINHAPQFGRCAFIFQVMATSDGLMSHVITMPFNMSWQLWLVAVVHI